MSASSERLFFSVRASDRADGLRRAAEVAADYFGQTENLHIQIDRATLDNEYVTNAAGFQRETERVWEMDFTAYVGEKEVQD